MFSEFRIVLSGHIKNNSALCKLIFMQIYALNPIRLPIPDMDKMDSPYTVRGIFVTLQANVCTELTALQNTVSVSYTIKNKHALSLTHASKDW